jgi:acetylglutamate kinase
MVLSGTINKQIVSTLNAAGGTAVGLSGKDGKLLEARRLELGGGGDLGFVGEPERVNIGVLQSFEKSHIIPVVAPIGIGPGGETYNINADTAAGAIASAMSAAKLILLTDVAGVLDKEGELISSLDAAETRALLDGSTIKGGMIPKLKTCLAALGNRCEAAHILDGRVPHSLLLEIFTAHGTGTMIVPDSE